MALRDSDKANLETLERAWKAGHVAMVESRDATTGEYRALLCAMGKDENGDIYPTPLAVMAWGNPFEQFVDPTVDTLPEATDKEA